MRGLFCAILAMSLASCASVDVAGPSQGDPPAPATVADFPAGAKVEWVGPNGAKAVVEPKLQSVTLAGGKIKYDYEALNWDTNGSPWPDVDSILCAFFWRNGKWVGGKFEWSRIDMHSQYVKNLTGGYVKAVMPLKEGEDMYFCIMKANTSKRTNALKIQWRSK